MDWLLELVSKLAQVAKYFVAATPEALIAVVAIVAFVAICYCAKW